MESANLKTELKLPHPLLEARLVPEVAIKGNQYLLAVIRERQGDVPNLLGTLIATLAEYSNMLMAQPDTSNEKDAYLTGVNHGALIVIWQYLTSLGYVLDVNNNQI